MVIVPVYVPTGALAGIIKENVDVFPTLIPPVAGLQLRELIQGLRLTVFLNEVAFVDVKLKTSWDSPFLIVAFTESLDTVKPKSLALGSTTVSVNAIIFTVLLGWNVSLIDPVYMPRGVFEGMVRKNEDVLPFDIPPLAGPQFMPGILGLGFTVISNCVAPVEVNVNRLFLVSPRFMVSVSVFVLTKAPLVSGVGVGVVETGNTEVPVVVFD